MTNEINPQNQINFGGVQVNQNEIASKKVVKENGATRYIINFKNGTTIKYPAQKKTNESRIKTNQREFFSSTSLSNLAYGEITGNPNDKDLIIMHGCNSCKIDLSNDNNADTVSLWDKVGHKGSSKNNQIKMGKEDEAELNDKNTLVKGEGLHIEGQK